MSRYTEPRNSFCLQMSAAKLTSIYEKCKQINIFYLLAFLITVLQKIINDKGGIVKSSVVLATDYLLVNEEYGSETTKYKKAIELNESDHHIAIINSRMLIKYAKA